MAVALHKQTTVIHQQPHWEGCAVISAYCLYSFLPFTHRPKLYCRVFLFSVFIRGVGRGLIPHDVIRNGKAALANS